MAAVGKAYSKQRDVVNSRRSFERAFECARKIEEPYTTAKVLREVAASQAEAGDVSGTAHVLEEAGSGCPDNSDRGWHECDRVRGGGRCSGEPGNKVASRTTFQLAIDAAKAYPDEEYVAQLCGQVMERRRHVVMQRLHWRQRKNCRRGSSSAGVCWESRQDCSQGERTTLDSSPEVKTDPPLEKGPPFTTERHR